MSSGPNIAEVTRLLKQLVAALPADPRAMGDVPGPKTKRLRRELQELTGRLNLLAQGLDPIRQPDFVFDPSNPEIVGRLIGRTLEEQPRHPLDGLPKFYGSGVYAIYYAGSFPAYRPIKERQTPIYVGKADPPTPDAKAAVDQGPKLCARLAEHAKSIRAAKTTLDIGDFNCRYLVVQSGWQRSAEDYLIHQFQPVWNQPLCYGFGKHGDDPRTRGNTRSPWDTLHPGRGWATREGNKPNPLSADQLVSLITEHYRRHPPRI